MAAPNHEASRMSGGAMNPASDANMHPEETQPPPTPRLEPRTDGLRPLTQAFQLLPAKFMIRHYSSLADESSYELPPIDPSRSGEKPLERIPELDMPLEQTEQDRDAGDAAQQPSQRARVPIDAGLGLAAHELGGERPVEGTLAEQERGRAVRVAKDVQQLLSTQKRVRFGLTNDQAQSTEQATDSCDATYTGRSSIDRKRDLSPASSQRAQSKVLKVWRRPPTPITQAADSVQPRPPDVRPERHPLPEFKPRDVRERDRERERERAHGPKPTVNVDQADLAPALMAPTLSASESSPPPQAQSPSAAAAAPPPPAPILATDKRNRKTQNAHQRADALDGREGVQNPKGPCTNCLKVPRKRDSCRTPRDPTSGKSNACNHCSRSKLGCKQSESAEPDRTEGKEATKQDPAGSDTTEDEDEDMPETA